MNERNEPFFQCILKAMLSVMSWWRMRRKYSVYVGSGKVSLLAFIVILKDVLRNGAKKMLSGPKRKKRGHLIKNVVFVLWMPLKSKKVLSVVRVFSQVLTIISVEFIQGSKMLARKNGGIGSAVHPSKVCVSTVIGALVSKVGSSSTCFDCVVVALIAVHPALIVLSTLPAVDRLSIRTRSPGHLVEPAVLVLRWVDDVLPATQSQLVAELDPAVPALDHGLDL